MSKGFVDAVVAGDLNTAGDEFLQAVQMKRDADWENAKLNLAHQVFGDAEAPEALEEPEEAPELVADAPDVPEESEEEE